LTEGIGGWYIKWAFKKKRDVKNIPKKNKKKFRNAVDIRKIIWYINEATCK